MINSESSIDSIEVFQEGPARIDPITKFEDAGLHPVMLKNVQLAGYDAPTPIQRYCLPAIHNGYDVIGIAQTGMYWTHLELARPERLLTISQDPARPPRTSFPS